MDTLPAACRKRSNGMSSARCDRRRRSASRGKSSCVPTGSGRRTATPGPAIPDRVVLGGHRPVRRPAHWICADNTDAIIQLAQDGTPSHEPHPRPLAPAPAGLTPAAAGRSVVVVPVSMPTTTISNTCSIWQKPGRIRCRTVRLRHPQAPGRSTLRQHITHPIGGSGQTDQIDGAALRGPPFGRAGVVRALDHRQYPVIPDRGPPRPPDDLPPAPSSGREPTTQRDIGLDHPGRCGRRGEALDGLTREVAEGRPG